ncbi:hypothetical protein BGZ93_008994 [Podila epicladia]|nr:hypothetical protein BGZ92_004403 [Podila epicladia]KAG0091077.1 hypothetical protein BGZ93_008994 [Podila epicladia]
MNSHQNKNQPSSSSSAYRQGLVHSTRSNLETFDQATRDAQLAQESSSPSSSQQFSNEAMAAGNRQPTLLAGANSESTLREANSAVQLDRDVQHSRKIADENRQKASGHARSVPVNSQKDLTYVE